MLQNKKIAFFIDVDNVGLTSEHYANVIEQLNAMGNILYGKIYGAGERKHKEIYADAAAHNYDTDRQMRVKRRGRKDFDSRIFVDVVDAVAKAASLDAVCIIAQPTDMVYLYSYLRRRGISVIALDNVDEQSREFIDEVVDLGKVEEIKLPKSKPAKSAPEKKAEPAPVEEPVAPVAKPAKEQATEKTDVDRTEELLREIERLRAQVIDEQPPVKQPVVEEPVVEPVQEAEEEPVVETVEEEPAPVKEPAKSEARPRAQYTAQNDSDLIRRIEELRRNNEGGDPDDLIDEIRKLLDLE